MRKYSISCGDVIPGCAAHLEDDSEEELMRQIADHARDEHGITEFSADVQHAVRAAISRQ